MPEWPMLVMGFLRVMVLERRTVLQMEEVEGCRRQSGELPRVCLRLVLWSAMASPW